MTTQRLGIDVVVEGGARTVAELERIRRAGDRVTQGLSAAARQQTGFSVGERLTRGMSEAARAAERVQRNVAAIKLPPQTVSAVDRLNASVGRFATGLVAGLGGREFVAAADAYTKLTAGLQIATNSQSEFNAALADVQRIARAAQADIGAVGQLYGRLNLALRESGTSQEDVARITEAVSLGLKAAGASANEAQSAILQLSQAFGSGVLRGEEFNAVFEAAPNILRAVAESLGAPVGALREMAAAGQLTSEVVGNALVQNLEKFRQDAEKVRTVGGAFTELSNTVLLAAGSFDKATGLSAAFAESLLGLADIINAVREAFGSVDAELEGFISRQEQINRTAGLTGSASMFFLPQLKQRLDALSAERLQIQRAINDAGLADDPFAAFAGTTRADLQVRAGEIDRELTRLIQLRDASRTPQLPATVVTATRLPKADTEAAVKAASDVATAYEALARSVEGPRAQAVRALGEAYRAAAGDQALFARAALDITDALDAQTASHQDVEAARRRAEADALRQSLETPREGAVRQLRAAQLAAGGDVELLRRAYADIIDDLDAQTEGWRDVQREVVETNRAAQELGFLFSSAFEDAIVGARGLGEVMQGIGTDIARILVRRNITEPFAEVVGSLDLGSIFGSFFGGARAAGGPVAGGRAYLVGERGPELFVPGASGAIVPNGAGGVVVNVINQSGGQVSASQSVGADGQTQIDVLVASAERRIAHNVAAGRSPIGSVLERRYGLSSAAGTLSRR